MECGVLREEDFFKGEGEGLTQGLTLNSACLELVSRQASQYFKQVQTFCRDTF